MESLDRAFSALSDPTRRAILDALADGEKTVNALAAPLPISQPAVSRHIKVLLEAGLIVQRVDGARRPCALSPEGLALMERWAADLRRRMSARYDKLDAVLAAMPSEREKGNETDT